MNGWGILLLGMTSLLAAITLVLHLRDNKVHLRYDPGVIDTLLLVLLVWLAVR